MVIIREAAKNIPPLMARPLMSYPGPPPLEGGVESSHLTVFCLLLKKSSYNQYL